MIRIGFKDVAERSGRQPFSGLRGGRERVNVGEQNILFLLCVTNELVSQLGEGAPSLQVPGAAATVPRDEFVEPPSDLRPRPADVLVVPRDNVFGQCGETGHSTADPSTALGPETMLRQRHRSGESHVYRGVLQRLIP